IDINIPFVKDMIKKLNIKLNYINTDNNIADVFTKALGKAKFYNFISKFIYSASLIQKEAEK
ncbi:MAG: hypothetical protein ACRCSB_02680, partial [Bacteroidales bacterium]